MSSADGNAAEDFAPHFETGADGGQSNNWGRTYPFGGSHVNPSWQAVHAMHGSVIGGRLVGRIPQDSLRRGFGWLVLGVAAAMVLRQVA